MGRKQRAEEAGKREREEERERSAPSGKVEPKVNRSKLLRSSPPLRKSLRFVQSVDGKNKQRKGAELGLRWSPAISRVPPLSVNDLFSSPRDCELSHVTAGWEFSSSSYLLLLAATWTGSSGPEVEAFWKRNGARAAEIA